MSSTRGLERRFILELAQGNWIDQHLNTLVLGPTGSGKSFMSCALGLSACRTNHSVRYYWASPLLFQLARSHLDDSYSKLLAGLAKIDLLILDDWMRDPISASETRDLLEILEDRFDRVFTLVASQLPVAEWFSQFPSPTHADAILDRLVHNAQRIQLEGESQRKLRSQRNMPNT